MTNYATHLNFHFGGVEKRYHVWHDPGINNHLYLIISSICQV